MKDKKLELVSLRLEQVKKMVEEDLEVVEIQPGARANDVYDIFGDTSYSAVYRGPAIRLEFVKSGN